MRKPVLFLIGAVLVVCALPALAEIALEPFTCTQNFESRAECGWASYPQWQDTAYDPNVRANTIVPGDPNIAVVQTVTPYSRVDNYAGLMKELDAWFTPGSSITLRYFLKTQLSPEFFQVLLAAGPDGKLTVTIPHPAANRWEWARVSWNDVLRENPKISGKNRVKVNGIAALAKFPDADPAMPIFFGLDDVTFNGAREAAFRFAEPKTFKLPDWKQYIPEKHYQRGERFTLRGKWPLAADRVDLRVVSFTDTAKTVLAAPLTVSGGEWSLRDYQLLWPEGMYAATLTAYSGTGRIAETPFTLFIAPSNPGGNHPRLWFDGAGKTRVENRLKSERFRKVHEGILSSAKAAREKNPADKTVWDIDQFPDEEWVASVDGWFDRITAWNSALHSNAMAFAFGGDREAGEYAKNFLVKLSSFPYLLHPWMIQRGHHIYYPVGELGMEMALGYDLLYNIMDDTERRAVRDGMMRNIVLGCHQGYVVDDLVISNTSNWVAHITGGSLMCQAAMYGDSPDMAPLEPYFTGAVLKDHDLIQKVTDRDGDYGEGWGYFNFSMLSWSKSLPALENVFKVDLSGRLNGAYRELAWAGRFKEKEHFYFGDSGGSLGAMTNFAWLLAKNRDPLLSHMYSSLKEGETFMDALYETSDIPKKDPYSDNPVSVFRDVGTTVFKSGWEKDDFVFVMRTGPFVNHQHIDQGTFWLGDRGATFIEERHGSTYYDDPLYQPWYTQPVAHSTILIDHNHQSQRTGDLLGHIDGFDDYAFIGQALDGGNAAFVSGDIGRLYWGKVKSLRRNVLYLKPRTLLMLDTVVPAEEDVDVTLLYQTRNLKDIAAGSGISSITKNGATLFINHLTPVTMEARAVETPHYLFTLRERTPLEREGMLTVTARTSGVPLVMANLLTTASGGVQPKVASVPGKGCVSGTVDGVAFIYSTCPGAVYAVNGIITDAAAVTGDQSVTFAALARTFSRGSTLLMETDSPVTFESSPSGFRYTAGLDCELTLGVPAKPASVSLNGTSVPFAWNAEKSAVTLKITKGNGVVIVK